MRTDKIRQYVLPNVPYLFILWCCLKLGTAYRLAAGAGFGEKLLGMIKTIGPAFETIAPGFVMSDFGGVGEDKFVSLIQRQFSWYNPRPVKRVEIPKPDGRTRPLGIPTIVDRMVQQCILQVMEPICEARFHDHSNGFRPNRGAENAITQCCRLMQVQNLHYVVDIDIKGFFDNVCHAKLIRQIWELGIRDKTLLCIMKAMLKAQIVLPDGERITPEKGTPQGGILSPLLSNIVLNELDWWVSSQWEEMPTHYPYRHRFNKAGTEIKSHTYRALRQSRLKEMHIVRYADDFKIFCRSHADAVRAFEATRLWLKDRLGLDISPEKSAVINLKKRYSDFLGFKLKVCKKGKKMVVCSHMSDKAKARAKVQLSACVKAMKSPADEKGQHTAIQQYNATVAGMHNYYWFATHICEDFCQIAQGIKKQLQSRLKELTRKGKLERGFIKERYGKSRQLRFLNGHPVIPVAYIRTKDALHKKKSVNRYTPEGRAEIHKNLGLDTNTIREGTKRRQPKNTEKHMFAGLLYCADCGRKLYFNVNHPHTELKYFNCSNYKGNRGTCTDTHYIRADALEQVMLLEIRRMTAFLQDKEEDFVKLLMSKSLQEAERESKHREQELRAMLARCRELDVLFTKTYEDNASGKLSDERFMMITKRYDDEQLALKKKISALQAEIDEQERHRHSAASFLRTVKKYTSMQELTPLILNELVEKIVVHQAEGLDKNRTQQLEIHYNFIGVLDTPEVAALPHSVTVDTRQGVAVEYITRKAG